MKKIKLIFFLVLLTLSMLSLSAFTAFAQTAEPYESNVNLLNMAGYISTLTVTEGIEFENGEISSTDNEKEIYTYYENNYLKAKSFMRGDTGKISDGSDLDYVVSAKVKIKDLLAPTQPWYGAGVIFGKVGGSPFVVRLMADGSVYVINTSNGMNYASRQSYGYAASDPEKVYEVEIYNFDCLISVYVNGIPCFEDLQLIDMEIAAGAMFVQSKSEIYDMSLKFIQPVVVPVPEGLSEQLFENEFSKGGINGGESQAVISGQDDEIVVNSSGIKDYYVMKTADLSVEQIYMPTYNERYEIINKNDAGTIIEFELSISSGGCVGAVFRNTENMYLATVFSSTEAKIIDTNGALYQKSGDFTQGIIKIYSDKDTVSVWCDNQSIFSNLSITALDACSGIYADNATATLKNYSYKFAVNAYLEEPQKETYPQKVEIPPANTQAIKPELPQLKSYPESIDTWVFIIIGIGGVALIAGGIFTFIILRKRRKQL